MPATMREQSTQKIYDIQSKVYDVTFGRLVRKRVANALKHLTIDAQHLTLDLGIGTGASLKSYPTDARVFGVDLSRGMLKKSADKKDELGMINLQLVCGNALQLPFADDTFDNLFVSHVISVVSDPVQMLLEARRVAKPGARMVILNHFQSDNKVIAKLEEWVNPLCVKIGWRSDLNLTELVRNAEVAIDYRFKLTSPDLWETVVLTNLK